jgi:hypothetical protein
MGRRGMPGQRDVGSNGETGHAQVAGLVASWETGVQLCGCARWSAGAARAERRALPCSVGGSNRVKPSQTSLGERLPVGGRVSVKVGALVANLVPAGHRPALRAAGQSGSNRVKPVWGKGCRLEDGRRASVEAGALVADLVPAGHRPALRAVGQTGSNRVKPVWGKGRRLEDGCP